MNDEQIKELTEEIYQRLVANGGNINWIRYTQIELAIREYLYKINLLNDESEDKQ